MLSNILLTVGIISFGISGVMLGAWTDGQRQRDYYAAEESEQRNVRLKSSLVFAVYSFFYSSWYYSFIITTKAMKCLISWLLLQLKN